MLKSVVGLAQGLGGQAGEFFAPPHDSNKADTKHDQDAFQK